MEAQNEGSDLDVGPAPLERRDDTQSRLRFVLDNMVDVVVHHSVTGEVLWVSPSLRTAFGWDPDDLVGTTRTLLDPRDGPGVHATLGRAQADSVVARGRLITADGRSRWVEGLTRLVRDGDGRVQSYVTTVRDIDEQVRAEAALHEAEHRFRLLTEHATDVIFQSGRDGRIVWASPSVEQMLGFRPAAALGTRVADYMHPSDVSPTRRFIRDQLALGENGGRTEARFRRADGSWRWMSMVGRAMFDDDGTLIGGIDTLRDVEAEHQAREELRRLATHDALTGLPNRRALISHLNAVMGRTDDAADRLAVLFVDLDHLKNVNDTYGHQSGDDVLVEVGQRLIAATVDHGALVTRFGGDEFVAVLEDVEDVDAVDAVKAYAQSIHTSLKAPIRIREELVTVQTSIGVAVRQPGETPEALLRRADPALFLAKTRGRGRTESDE